LYQGTALAGPYKATNLRALAPGLFERKRILK
jgi:hypothetical protein